MPGDHLIIRSNRFTCFLEFGSELSGVFGSMQVVIQDRQSCEKRFNYGQVFFRGRGFFCTKNQLHCGHSTCAQLILVTNKCFTNLGRSIFCRVDADVCVEHVFEH